MGPAPEQEIDWEATTWQGCRRRQIEQWAELSLDDIFAVQEEMAEFARAVGALPDESITGDRDGLPRDEC